MLHTVMQTGVCSVMKYCRFFICIQLMFLLRILASFIFIKLLWHEFQMDHPMSYLIGIAASSACIHF